MRSETGFVGRVFDLRVESDIDLPRIARDPKAQGETVTIHAGHVPPRPDEEVTASKPYFAAEGSRFWMNIPDVARVLVRDGTEIVYEPEPGVDQDTLLLFLLGSGLGALMIQRQALVMHANGINVDGRVVLCMGPSGIGKSTLAAAFAQRRYQLFADDVCPIDPDGLLHPGAATIKLWDQSARHFEIDTGPLRRVRPELEKFDFPVSDVLSAEPLPVGLFVELAEHDEDRFDVTPVTGADTYAVLRRNSYRLEFVYAMNLLKPHFQACARIASNVPVIRVTRPKAGMDVNGLMDVILSEAEKAFAKR